jgi:hypothetical protein
MGTKQSRAAAVAQALNSEAGFGTRSGLSNRALIGVSFVWSVCFVVQKEVFRLNADSPQGISPMPTNGRDPKAESFLG